MNIEAELDAALTKMDQDYNIPKGAFTFEDMQKKYPNVPKNHLRQELQQRVKAGKLIKRRVGQQTYHWPTDETQKAR